MSLKKSQVIWQP